MRDTLRQMPPETASRVYAKIISDLSRERAPLMAVDDFCGLLDACPTAPDDAVIRNLGDVGRVVMHPEERGLLGTRMELGTAFFGGRDFTKRLNLGRVMLQAHLDDLARQYLPAPAEMNAVTTEAVQREILQFHKIQEDLRDSTAAKEKRIEDIERDFADVTAACFGEAEARRKAELDLQPFFGQRLPQGAVVEAVRTRLAESGRDLVPAYLARLSEIFEYYRSKNAAPVVRLNNLVLQVELADLVAELADPRAAPWNPVLLSLAGNWMAEAADTLHKKEVLEKTGKNDNFVSPGDLLATMPTDAWLQSLTDGLRERVLVMQVRVLMFASRWDEAFQKTASIGRSNPMAATQLTAECLDRWARTHDPTIPEDVRKKFALAQSQIVVTPLVAARNLAYYADIMALMRTNRVPMKDMGYLLDVYEHSQGAATPYRREDLEKVFGPVAGLDPESFLTLVTRLRIGLGDRWRRPDVQDHAAVLGLVQTGYAAALRMIDDWTARQPVDWKALREAAVMASDWADFEYFQKLVKSPKPDAQARYDAMNRISQDYFRRAAARYLKTAAQGVRLAETEETLFVTWFKHLMGFNSNGEINLSKAPGAPALQEMRDLINSLPPDAAKAQMAALAGYADAMTADPKALDPNMKFRFLQSSLLITMGSSFAEATSNKVEYLETLLDGVRLEVAMDGPNTIWRKEDAGIIVSLRHTDVMSRQLNFASILGADAPPKPTDRARKMLATDTVRNELESNILKALSPFFDVRSITLSPATVKSFPAKEPRWEQTVLAYVVIRAFDVSVDRIPQLTLTLTFLDKSGPVALPVKSPEVMIRMSEHPPGRRPVADLRLTQTFDTRQLDSTGELKLAITAVGTGLLPPLEELVDLQPLERSITVTRVVPLDGPVVREILDSNQVVSVTSERHWRIDLDGRKIARAGTRSPVYYPAPYDKTAAVRNDYYEDADLVGATNAFALVGKGDQPELIRGADGQFRTADHTRQILTGSAAGAAVLLFALLLVLRARRNASAVPALQARDVFHLPARMEPFIVVSLLRNLLASELVHISEEQRRAVTDEMRRVEEACFRPGGAGMTEAELSRVAKQALKTCC